MADRTAEQHRHDLRAIVADGTLFSAMVGLGETYVPAFALALGFGAVTAGLLATLPMLAGAVFQLITPIGVRAFASYRRWVVLCARLQALSFIPLILAAVWGAIGIEWVAAAAVAYWGFGMATSPAWNAWVTTLVPVRERASFFAHRARLAQAALMASLIWGGVVLELGRGTEFELLVFAALFVAAICARLGSSYFLSRQSETPGLAASHPAVPVREIVAGLRAEGALPILAYLLALQAATHVAVPFFTPYMLGPLELSYASFMGLTAAAFASRIAVLPWLGRVAESRGPRQVLWFGAVGVVPLPSLWLVSDHLAYLLVLQLAAGVAWAAVEYATLLLFFEGINERIRASVLTVYNLANALLMAAGSLVGAWIFETLDDPGAAYAALFVVSSAGRLVGLFLIPKKRGLRHRVHRFALRTLAIRPSAGAVQRPILAELEDGATPEASPAVGESLAPRPFGTVADPRGRDSG